MTTKQKFLANEQREDLFRAAEWLCVVSGRPLRSGMPQLAHRVARTKARLEKYGSEVIDHPLNLVPVRGLRENDACNIGNRPAEARALLDRIIKIITGRESEPDMRKEYEILREQFAAEKRILTNRLT